MRYQTEKRLWIGGITSVIVLFITFWIWGLYYTSSGEQTRKHLLSGFSGLERTVTFYDCNGKVIKSWTGDLNIEDQGGTIRFVANGKAIIVGGNFVVEEK